MSAPLELSLVIPVYNERDNLPVLVEEIGRALAGRAGGEPYEIVAVDDGSTDGSLDVLKVLKREHPEIHIVALAANAGQSAAFGAGFGAAAGASSSRSTRICRTIRPTFQSSSPSSSGVGRRRWSGTGWTGGIPGGSGFRT